MRILIVRHAIATERGVPPYGSDEERPLTEKGVSRMRTAARGIACVVPTLTAIYTSPLVRAVQTADLLSEAYEPRPRPTVAAVLAPGHAPTEIMRWLHALDPTDVVALVGHEPGCSTLLSYLLVADGGLAVDFKKGAAALMEVGFPRGRPHAILLWFASPKLLRAAGD